jgi:hypothetical protein
VTRAARGGDGTLTSSVLGQCKEPGEGSLGGGEFLIPPAFGAPALLRHNDLVGDLGVDQVVGHHDRDAAVGERRDLLENRVLAAGVEVYL